VHETIGKSPCNFTPSEGVYGTPRPGVVMSDKWIGRGRLTEPAVFNVNITVEWHRLFVVIICIRRGGHAKGKSYCVTLQTNFKAVKRYSRDL
jgi:hypothetical protein